MENKEKLLKIISDSNLDLGDKEMWQNFFDSNPEKALEAYVDVFASFPEELGWFNEIMKRKIAAMILIQGGDIEGEKKMKEIIEDEKKKLEELSEKL